MSDTGGDLRETGGTVPSKNLKWGTAHSSVPPIFWELLLLDVRQSMNWVKKVIRRNLGWKIGVFGEEKHENG